ncbi:diguanylate cyclase [Leeia sp. TBRC 13508]|uniref:Diguanylate cyclase n=1 Tax=Leeia speluncae TaxID=2884804 RepID=A0ABS8D6W4_9NEIS|nr:GAF domain-containing protein [Leeia speluncae]MCB6183934.1 diguanylate cyclase [Leeia speluncae]
MQSVPLAPNESERLASLKRMLILATPDEEVFDRVTRVAQRYFQVPIALITLLDEERQWFKSCIGLPIRETERNLSFCTHAILSDDVMMVEDAREDPRFCRNPFVTGAPHIVFYAGYPIKNSEGFRLGTLCIVDHQRRKLTHQEKLTLKDLGVWVEQVMKLRTLSEVQTQMLEVIDEAERRSLLDNYLNIWNKTAIIDVLNREVNRAYRHQRALSLMMVRIENMAALQAQYGDAFTASATLDVVRNIRSVTRSFDSIGVYDFDSFMVVLPESDAIKTAEIWGKLHEATGMLPCLVGDELIDLTLKVGICSSTFVGYTPNPQEMMMDALIQLNKPLPDDLLPVTDDDDYAG